MSSSRKGRSLADVVADIDDEPVVETAPKPSPVKREGEGAVTVQPAIVPINILVTPEDRRRLRQLSLDTGLSLQKLGHEAWNAMLRSRGLEPLASVSANVPSGRLKSR
jgi:hypothetical protein